MASKDATRRDHLYGDPHVYDVLHDDGTRADAKVFVRLARTHLPKPLLARAGKSLHCFEPACGSGRFLHALAKLGHLATGLDLSQEMLAYARARAKRLGVGALVKTLHAPMDCFALPPSAKAYMAFNPINSIRHLPSDASMVRHLRCVRDALHPGGVYIVGLSLAAYGLESPSEDVWIGTRDGLRVTQVVQFEPPDPSARGAAARRERVLSHLTIEEVPTRGRLAQHRDSRYWLRTYSLAQWKLVVRRAGWTIAGTYSNEGHAMEAREPGYFLFVLTQHKA